MSITRRILGLSLICVCVTSISTAQTLYEVYELGGAWWPKALSNNGIVVGTIPEETIGSESPGIWQDGVLSVLPLPDWSSTDPDRSNEYGWAVDIDDNGERIIGGVQTNVAIWPNLVLWEESGVEALAEVISVQAINNQGQMVVSGGGASGRFGVLLGPDSVELEAASDEMYDAVAINNLGQVVGYGPEANYNWDAHFCLWENGEIFRIQDLVATTIPFDSSWAVDINDNTQIVGGYAYDDDGQGAFLYEAGSIQFIGDFNAAAINESAQVVGDNYLFDYDTELLIDLNGRIDPESGWEIAFAEDINDEDAIIGTGYLNGDDQAFMLVPCDAATYFRDQDGDGYGDARDTRLACGPQSGYVEANGVEELIPNGEMEGDGNWPDWETPFSNSRTQDHVYQGRYARMVSCDEPIDGVRSEFFRLTAGETYRATLWVYGDSSTSMRVRIYKDEGHQYAYRPNDAWPVPPAQWTRYSWTFTPTSSDLYTFVVQLAPGNISGTFYLDSVSVTQSIAAISDCSDNNAAVHPGAQDICNEIDDNCDGDIDEDCIENESPVADAGSDQQVAEGATVTLDGSNSMDPDDGIDTWLWEQVGGAPVVLSDETVANPTFVTPIAADEDLILTFRLTVTDSAGAAVTDKVRVGVTENHIGGDWLPDDAITMRTHDGKAIGIKILQGGSLVAIKEATDAVREADNELPDDLSYGPLWLNIRTNSRGGNVKLAWYFQESLESTHAAYIRSMAQEWIQLDDQVVLSSDRSVFKTDIVNGGDTDEDGEENRSIATTIAIGRVPSRGNPDDPRNSGSSGSGGGGCFIQSLGKILDRASS